MVLKKANYMGRSPNVIRYVMVARSTKVRWLPQILLWVQDSQLKTSVKHWIKRRQGHMSCGSLPWKILPWPRGMMQYFLAPTKDLFWPPLYRPICVSFSRCFLIFFSQAHRNLWSCGSADLIAQKNTQCPKTRVLFKCNSHASNETVIISKILKPCIPYDLHRQPGNIRNFLIQIFLVLNFVDFHNTHLNEICLIITE